ncbi:MAG: hypothetical protein ACYSRR_04380 [Planctomycetota bacterium]
MLASAVPPPASATCKISCTVANIVEWSEISFPKVDLGSLTAKNKQAIGKTTLILYTNGDVILSADNDNSAELSFGPNTLLTKYKLRYDGSGVKQTGGRATAWRSFDTFLEEGADIIHIPTDGAVEVILSIRASIKNIRPENSGQYNAIQTLTACWKS